MSQAEERFQLLAEAIRNSTPIDGSEIFDGLSPEQALELRDLMDGFLSSRRSQPADPAAFEKARLNDPIVERFGRSVTGNSGLWPSTLPRLRAQRKLGREEVVSQLSEILGAPEGSEKIETYYHRMEWGDLPSEGVNRSVIDALAAIFDTDAEDLSNAGAPLVEPAEQADELGDANEMSLPAPPSSPGVFARTINLDGQEPSAVQSDGARSSDDWDATDRLFLGG